MANNRPRNDEDTEAILNRRRFLIESTLAGAGIGAVLSGCEAQPCLKIKPEPRQCLDVPPDRPTSKPTEPQVCLSVEISPLKVHPPASSQPAACLKVEVKPPKPPPGPCLRPGPCLSIRRKK
jgi:hypothetical protein